MPTYRNDTDKKITDHDRNYMEWLPGQERVLKYYIPHEFLGLVKVEEAVTPSTSLFRDWTIELTPGDPLTLDLLYFEAFELSIYAESGYAIVKIGENGSLFSVLKDESHFSLYSYSRCPSITMESTVNSIIRVKQEERNTKNTLRRGS